MSDENLKIPQKAPVFGKTAPEWHLLPWMRRTKPMRFLFYSHDGLGLGHTRRHLAVASALAQKCPEALILLATGAEEFIRRGLPRQVEIIKLPGLRKDANNQYSSRRLRVTTAEIRALRSELLLTAVRTFQPGVVLVDKHPFGASGEFKAGLKALKRFGGQAVLGLRDILDEPSHVFQEWRPYRMQQRIAEHYDEILVYGERAVFDPIRAYEFPPALARRTRFCGYVLHHEPERSLENFDWPFPPRNRRERPVVLATAGGGEDGDRTLETFIRAAVDAPWQGVVVAGPMTPDAELARMEKLAAGNNVAFRHFVPHLSALFESLDALVCMGGYNTLVEATAHGVPTVCVPRVVPRTEQLIRAHALERLGLIQVCHPDQLDPQSLGRRISAALKTPPRALQNRARAALNFNGAERAADFLIAREQQWAAAA
jgi:predicted glycosyltransferase